MHLEWNQIYWNIDVHYKEEHFNLDLDGIRGSRAIEHCANVVEGCLKSFNLDIEDEIIDTTTDTANMMGKFVRLMLCYQKLCYVQGTP